MTNEPEVKSATATLTDQTSPGTAAGSPAPVAVIVPQSALATETCAQSSLTLPTASADASANTPVLDPVPNARTPASVPTTFPIRQAVEVPERVLRHVAPDTVPLVRRLFKHVHLIAGYALDDYFDLVEVVFQDFKPYQYAELAFSKQIVDEEFRILMFAEVQRIFLNAEIGEGVLDEIADVHLAAETSAQERTNHLARWRRIVFGAISGDPMMAKAVDEKLGANHLNLTIYSVRHIVGDLRAHIFADAVMTAALERRNRAIALLEKLCAERYQRMQIREPRAEDVKYRRAALSLSEYAKTLIERTVTDDRSETKVSQNP